MMMVVAAAMEMLRGAQIHNEEIKSILKIIAP